MNLNLSQAPAVTCGRSTTTSAEQASSEQEGEPSTTALHAEDEQCPACGNGDYGYVDLAWPFGLPEHNPQPHISHVVGVCLDCGHVTD